MKSIHTEIIINSSQETVWNTLMNFKDYSDWNPFIKVTGEAKVGTQLKNTIYPDGQKPQVFKPTVMKVEEQKEFRWKGQLFVKGLFDGEHYFQLQPTSEGHTKLIHGESFTGILSAVVFNMIGEETKAGFDKMNQALKKRCEEQIDVLV